MLPYCLVRYNAFMDEHQTDYYNLSYDDFLKALDREISEHRKAWGIPEGYQSTLSGVPLIPSPRENVILTSAEEPPVSDPDLSLAEVIELLSKETLGTELRLLSAESSAVRSIALSIDSRKSGDRERDGNISELLSRAFTLGARNALLIQRYRQLLKD